MRNEALRQKRLVATRRSACKHVTSGRFSAARLKPSYFHGLSSGKKATWEGFGPHLFNFLDRMGSSEPVFTRSSLRMRSATKVKTEDTKTEQDTSRPPSNSTDITLQITSDHNYCPQTTMTATSPTNVKLQIRTDDHNYCPSSGTNVELHINRALSSDHNYCPPDKPSSSTAVTLRIHNDAAAPDHNYHCPRSPTKMVRRLKVSEDKCLVLTKKLKVARQKIRRQNAKITALQNTIANLAQRLCPVAGSDARKTIQQRVTS